MSSLADDLFQTAVVLFASCRPPDHSFEVLSECWFFHGCLLFQGGFAVLNSQPGASSDLPI